MIVSCCANQNSQDWLQNKYSVAGTLSNIFFLHVITSFFEGFFHNVAKLRRIGSNVFSSFILKIIFVLYPANNSILSILLNLNYRLWTFETFFACKAWIHPNFQTIATITLHFTFEVYSLQKFVNHFHWLLFLNEALKLESK